MVNNWERNPVIECYVSSNIVDILYICLFDGCICMERISPGCVRV